MHYAFLWLQLFFSIVLPTFTWYRSFCKYWRGYFFFNWFNFYCCHYLFLNILCNTFLFLLRELHVHTLGNLLLWPIRLISHDGRRPALTAAFSARSMRWPWHFQCLLRNYSLYLNLWHSFFVIRGLLASSIDTDLVWWLSIRYFGSSIFWETCLKALPAAGNVFFVGLQKARLGGLPLWILDRII